jgi:predicted acylesterase/phospholipase RssA
LKKVLTIDGGGVRGVLPASFLATVEDSLGEPVVDYFDLIVGTSTGGIIALGLAAGLPAQEILDLYVQRGRDIFRGLRLPRAVRSLALVKYDERGLRDALTETLGAHRLGDSRTRVVVPSFDINTGEVRIWKTAHHPRFERDYKEAMVEVAMATSAAPTYFQTHLTAKGTPLIDGGVFANNPVGLAAVEARSVLEWEAGDVTMLSLGCGTEALSVGHGRRRRLGRLYWMTKLAETFMAAQSSSSLGTAQLLVGHENVLRLEPTLPQGRYGLDVVKEIPALEGLGDSEARNALPELRRRFFDSKAEPFTPCRQ